MRKVLDIAVCKYLATVRTKEFEISLLLMPILMSGGYVARRLLGDQMDVRGGSVTPFPPSLNLPAEQRQVA